MVSLQKYTVFDREESVTGKNGGTILLGSNKITVLTTNGIRHLNFQILHYYLKFSVFEKVKSYFKFLFERQSARTSITFFDGLRLLSEALTDSASPFITEATLHRFKHLVEQQKSKHAGGKIRAWLLWDFNTSEKPILTGEQAKGVSEWKFAGVRAYAAIREGRDGVGPLDHRDDILLCRELRRASAHPSHIRQLTDWQVRTVIMLIRRLGCRSAQICDLKVEDLQIWTRNGKRVGVLQIPSVKDGEAPRTNFQTRRLTPELLKMVEESIRHRSLDAVGGWLFSRTSPNNFPEGTPTEQLWRMRSIEKTIASWVRSRKLKSVDGKILNAGPRRLRYTLATEMASKMTPIELAHVLGHKDARSVMHYYTYADDFFSRLSKIDGATKWGLAAATFAGIVSDQPTPGGDGGPIVFGPQLHLGYTALEGIGRCGAQTQCHLFPPLSCYGCHRFRPDPFADHSSVLTTLINWREARPRQIGKTKDPLQAQLDDVIEAVGYLVGILPAYRWTLQLMKQSRPPPSFAEIAQAADVSADVLAADRSVQALLAAWPQQQRGERRISKRLSGSE